MTALTPLDSFTVPLGGQAIELQQIDYVEGGMSLLQVRIREGKRFTIFDIDPATARRWGEALLAWSGKHPSGSGAGNAPPAATGEESTP
ncbi:MAG: hypothetical protein IT515_00070 [Burkholderiales bacterium]|nr:hypothetical protein [Burkholderiales bacterium]